MIKERYEYGYVFINELFEINELYNIF